MPQLGDVNQPLGAGHDLDECAERGRALHRSLVDLSDNGFGCDRLHHLARPLHRLTTDGGDRHEAGVVHRNLRTRLVLDPANRLALGADEVADLLRTDLHGHDAGSKRRQVGLGLGHRLPHLPEDVHPAFLRLRQRLGHQLEVESLDLDVHLDRRDALRSARHLEVHVTQVIFGAEDVGEDRVLLAFLDQSHRDTGHGAVDRHARVEESQRRPTDRRHGTRPVGLEDLGHDAQRIGKLLERRQHGLDGALGEVAVADFTAARAPHRSDFASREGREVVVQHEALGRLLGFVNRIEPLHVVGRAEGRRHQRLRLAAGEQRGAVGARQEPRVDRDGAHLRRLAPVHPKPGVEHLGTERHVFEVAKRSTDERTLIFGQLDRQLLLHVRLDRFDGEDAALLVSLVDRGLHACFGFGPDAVGHGRRCFLLRPRHLRLRIRGQQLVLHRNQVADAPLADLQRLDHVLFRDLERAPLDHHDRVVRTGDHEVHVGELKLLERRVEHPLALHAAHADACDRLRKRDFRRVQRVAGGDQPEDVGVVLLVGADHVDEDLHFVLEPLGEQRPDRAVDDAAGEDFLVAGAPFALDEAAGDLARRVCALLVLDRKREERQRALLVAHRDGGQDHGVAELDQRRSGGLLGHATRLDDQRAAGECLLNALHVSHVMNGGSASGRQRATGDPRSSPRPAGAPSRLSDAKTRGPLDAAGVRASAIPLSASNAAQARR